MANQHIILATMDNDEHFIVTQLSNLNEKDKHGFLSLTKCIIELQQQDKFNVLNMETGNPCETLFQNYPAAEIWPENYRDIYRMYEEAELFEEIRKCVHKTTKINKRLSPILRNYIATPEEQDHFKRFINMIVLCNLIKKQLKHKSPQDIAQYGLLEKLHAVNPNMATWLNLHQVNNLHTKEDIDSWLDDAYTYDNMHVPHVMDLITEDEYNAVYPIFSRFVSLKTK